ncbi:MAG: hypothetical protein ACI4JW_08380 [Oscillospiraceae bacterium]
MFKILKYDLKTTFGKYALFYLIVFLLSVCIAFFYRLVPNEYSEYYTAVSALSETLGFFTSSVFWIAAVLIPLLRFREFYFGKQAQLSLMLPVPAAAQLLSKTLHAAFWLVFSCLCAQISSLAAMLITSDEKISISRLIYSVVSVFGSGELSDAFWLSYVHVFSLGIFLQLACCFVMMLSALDRKRRSFTFAAASIVTILFIGSLYGVYSSIGFKILVNISSVSAWLIMNIVFFAVLSVILFVFTARILKKRYELI